MSLLQNKYSALHVWGANMVPAIIADLCREHSADVVNAELVKTMAVHAMKELFGQVIHCLSGATDYISGIRGTCHKYSLKTLIFHW